MASLPKLEPLALEMDRLRKRMKLTLMVGLPKTEPLAPPESEEAG